MSRTLLEKLDASCAGLSLRESVRNQVQRIISTRTYLGSEPLLDSWVTSFGMPEIVSEYSHVGDAHLSFRRVLREKILAFEPRIVDLKVTALDSSSHRASCQLHIQLEDDEIEEQFFFNNE